MLSKGSARTFIIIFVLLILGGIGYLVYQKLLPQVEGVLPTPNNVTSSISPDVTTPAIREPRPGSQVKSPLTILGVVPSGWMFEGTFPIKLIDKNRSLIAQGSATEEVPGSWQSGGLVYFKAVITFSTTAKSGYIVLENDNPSGDPSKSKTYELPVSF